MIRLFFVFWKLHSKSTWLKNLRGHVPLHSTYTVLTSNHQRIEKTALPPPTLSEKLKNITQPAEAGGKWFPAVAGLLQVLSGHFLNECQVWKKTCLEMHSLGLVMGTFLVQNCPTMLDTWVWFPAHVKRCSIAAAGANAQSWERTTWEWCW